MGCWIGAGWLALLSHDLPHSRWLGAALLLILVTLAPAPFLFPGARGMSVAAKILVFVPCWPRS